MSDRPKLTDEQIDVLNERLGLNLQAQTKIANETLDFFVERCKEEDINHNDMLTIAEAFRDRVKDAYMEALEDE